MDHRDLEDRAARATEMGMRRQALARAESALDLLRSGKKRSWDEAVIQTFVDLGGWLTARLLVYDVSFDVWMDHHPESQEDLGVMVVDRLRQHSAESLFAVPSSSGD